jgi:hypothetical protein
VGDHAVQFFESIGEAVGELYAGVLIIPKKMRKTQLIKCLILIVLANRIGVDYSAASASPFSELLHIAVAHLHALTVQAATFGESANDEMRFASESLHAEVEPS